MEKMENGDPIRDATKGKSPDTLEEVVEILARSFDRFKERIESRARMNFDGMTPMQAAESIITTVVASELISAITAACQHFSNEALERGRRKDWQSATKEFMVKFCQHRQEHPGFPAHDVMDLRIKLICEEFCEFLKAAGYEGNLWVARFDEGTQQQDEVYCWSHEATEEDRRDLPDTVDGIVDLLYVLIGTCESLGVQMQPIWEAVHAANMRKEGGGTRMDGKILKPPGWVAPDVAGLLKDQGWGGE